MGLAFGYLKRPELTAEKFIPDPFSAEPGARLYKTGDLVRQTPDGNLEFLGRLDQQVKIRGFRIELGEIEAALTAHPDLLQAAVVARAGGLGDKRLVAFVVAGEQVPEPGALRAFLKATLPGYMLPAAIVSLPALPLTTAGKIDRLALLALSPFQAARAGTPPRDSTEQKVAKVWSEQLGLPFMNREEDFFERGGDSLRAIAAIGRLRLEFQVRVNDLYEHPVLADFARFCQPSPDHLRARLREAASASAAPSPFEADRRARRASYLARTSPGLERLGAPICHGQVLLTGATGYLGSYLLRELLADGQTTVAALVRGAGSGRCWPIISAPRPGPPWPRTPGWRSWRAICARGTWAWIRPSTVTFAPPRRPSTTAPPT